MTLVVQVVDDDGSITAAFAHEEDAHSFIEECGHPGMRLTYQEAPMPRRSRPEAASA